MVDLESIYGNHLFSKKVYKSSKFIAIIANVIIDLILAILIVAIFGIRQDYAILKVFGLMYLFALAIRPIAWWPFKKLNIKYFLSKAVTSEIDHYFHVFKTGLTEENSGCYEDYLLEAAFNESFECKMRILAAIQYAKILNLIEIRPEMDRVFLDAWHKVTRKSLYGQGEDGWLSLRY